MSSYIVKVKHSAKRLARSFGTDRQTDPVSLKEIHVNKYRTKSVCIIIFPEIGHWTIF